MSRVVWNGGFPTVISDAQAFDQDAQRTAAALARTRESFHEQNGQNTPTQQQPQALPPGLAISGSYYSDSSGAVYYRYSTENVGGRYASGNFRIKTKRGVVEEANPEHRAAEAASRYLDIPIYEIRGEQEHAPAGAAIGAGIATQVSREQTYQAQQASLREQRESLRSGFAGTFSDYAQRMAAAPIGTPIPSQQEYMKIQQLQSGKATFGSESEFRQVAAPLAKYGEFAGITQFQGKIIQQAPSLQSFAPSAGYQYESPFGKGLIKKENFPGSYQRQYPSTQLDYNREEKYWQTLSPFQKAVGLTVGTVWDFGVASSYIQSKFTPSETGYKERIYEFAPRGEKKTLKGAGEFAYRGLTGQATQTAVMAYGIGLGAAALRLSPTALKIASAGSVFAQTASAAVHIKKGRYGEAITETGAFIASTPFVAAGYVTKLPVSATYHKMFGYSQAQKAPSASMAEIKEAFTPSYKKMFGASRTPAETKFASMPEIKSAITPSYQKMFGTSKYEPAPIATGIKESLTPTYSKIFGTKRGFPAPSFIPKVEISLFERPQFTRPTPSTSGLEILKLPERPGTYKPIVIEGVKGIRTEPISDRYKLALERGAAPFAERGVMGIRFGSKGYRPTGQPKPESGLRSELKRFMKEEKAVSYIPTYEKIKPSVKIMPRVQTQTITRPKGYVLPSLRGLTVMPHPALKSSIKFGILTSSATKTMTDTWTQVRTKTTPGIKPYTQTLFKTMVQPTTKTSIKQSVYPVIMPMAKAMPQVKPITKTATKIATRTEYYPRALPKFKLSVKKPSLKTGRKGLYGFGKFGVIQAGLTGKQIRMGAIGKNINIGDIKFVSLTPKRSARKGRRK